MSRTVAPAARHSSFGDGLSTAGALITLDGPSGVGKTTVAALVAELLSEDETVLCTAEPSDSEIGRLARHGTHQFRGLALSLLVAADRYHHSEAVITPAVAAGKIVICDRYMPSALVLDRLDGVQPGFVTNVYRHLPRPDIAFFLTDEPEESRRRAAARGGSSRFHRTDAEAAGTEAAMFAQVADDLAGQGYPVTIVKVAGREAPQVAARIAKIVASYRTADTRTKGR